jgi:hypothetical protein
VRRWSGERRAQGGEGSIGGGGGNALTEVCGQAHEAVAVDAEIAQGAQVDEGSRQVGQAVAVEQEALDVLQVPHALGQRQGERHHVLAQVDEGRRHHGEAVVRQRQLGDALVQWRELVGDPGEARVHETKRF